MLNKYLFGNYHTFEEIEYEIKKIEKDNSKFCKIDIIGESVKGNPIYSIAISDFRFQISDFLITNNEQRTTKNNNELSIGKKDLPAILYMALFHGTEFIGTEMTMALLKEVVNRINMECNPPSPNFRKGKIPPHPPLIKGAGGIQGELNKNFAERLKKVKLLFIPVINPDAHIKITELLKSFGVAGCRKNFNSVDLNRNFPAGYYRSRIFSFFSGSNFKFSSFCKGVEPFSEPETKAFRDFAYKNNIKASISFHSFSNMILYPYGYTLKRPKDNDKFIEIARAMRKRQKDKYKIMQTSDCYYICGDPDDWLYDEFGTLAYTVEIGKLNLNLRKPTNIINPFSYFNTLNVEKAVKNNIEASLYLMEVV